MCKYRPRIFRCRHPVEGPSGLAYVLESCTFGERSRVDFGNPKRSCKEKTIERNNPIVLCWDCVACLGKVESKRQSDLRRRYHSKDELQAMQNGVDLSHLTEKLILEDEKKRTKRSEEKRAKEARAEEKRPMKELRAMEDKEKRARAEEKRPMKELRAMEDKEKRARAAANKQLKQAMGLQDEMAVPKDERWEIRSSNSRILKARGVGGKQANKRGAGIEAGWDEPDDQKLRRVSDNMGVGQYGDRGEDLINRLFWERPSGRGEPRQRGARPGPLASTRPPTNRTSRPVEPNYPSGDFNAPPLTSITPHQYDTQGNSISQYTQDPSRQAPPSYQEYYNPETPSAVIQPQHEARTSTRPQCTEDRRIRTPVYQPNYNTRPPTSNVQSQYETPSSSRPAQHTQSQGRQVSISQQQHSNIQPQSTQSDFNSQQLYDYNQYDNSAQNTSSSYSQYPTQPNPISQQTSSYSYQDPPYQPPPPSNTQYNTASQIDYPIQQTSMSNPPFPSSFSTNTNTASDYHMGSAPQLRQATPPRYSMYDTQTASSGPVTGMFSTMQQRFEEDDEYEFEDDDGFVIETEDMYSGSRDDRSRDDRGGSGRGSESAHRRSERSHGGGGGKHRSGYEGRRR